MGLEDGRMKTFVLIWILTMNGNSHYSGSAEFNSVEQCEKVMNYIISTHSPLTKRIGPYELIGCFEK